MCANEASQIIGIEQCVKSFIDEFEQIYLGKMDDMKSVFLSAKNDVQKYVSSDDFKRRFSMNFLKELTVMLKNEEINHHDFLLDTMKSNEFWQPIAKLILVKRIDELKHCKILKKGRKYNISGLKETFLGKFITDRLGFTRRSIVNDTDYNKITNAIKKLKYEVPIVIQPTETEKFFGD